MKKELDLNIGAKYWNSLSTEEKFELIRSESPFSHKHEPSKPWGVKNHIVQRWITLHAIEKAEDL
jgi:hypothetical protein